MNESVISLKESTTGDTVEASMSYETSCETGALMHYDTSYETRTQRSTVASTAASEDGAASRPYQ